MISKRVELLNEAARLTGQDRNREYGEPRPNMQCAGELKEVIRRWRSRSVSPAELEALDMCCTKMARLMTGKPKADTYIDLAAYAAIAGEIGLADAAQKILDDAADNV